MTGTHPAAAVAAPGPGKITIYSSPGIHFSTGSYTANLITAGPDGAVWFTNPANNTIGRITTTGKVTDFKGKGINNPWAITAGSDGAVWFTIWDTASIGRISTTGKVRVFTGAVNGPSSIASGPDGALWYTNWPLVPATKCSWSIGRITTSGKVTMYPVSRIPGAIAVGSDGALWFTCLTTSAIGRITTRGVVSRYFTGPGISRAGGIAAGPDGALWFLNTGNNTVGRITTTGQVSSYSGSLGFSSRANITAGPDGAMWFTNPDTNTIGRITTSVTPGIDHKTPASGPPGTLVTITGRNLSPATQVAFNGTPATIVSDTSTYIVTIVPRGATTGRIAVTTPAGTAVKNGWFTVR